MYVVGEKLKDSVIPLNLKILFSNARIHNWQGIYFCGYITTASDLTQIKQGYMGLHQTIPESELVMTLCKVVQAGGNMLTSASRAKKHGSGQAMHQKLET